MSLEVLHQLNEKLGGQLVASHSHRGDETAVVTREALRETLLWLKQSPALAFDMLVDLTAVDHLEQGQSPRFEVVYHLYSVTKRHRLRVKVGVCASDPIVPSVSDLWGNANWCEREVWDLYGIRFENHPDMRRILLYEEFEGHPLRKDYPKEKRQPLVRRPRKELEQVVLGRGIGNKRSLV